MSVTIVPQNTLDDYNLLLINQGLGKVLNLRTPPNTTTRANKLNSRSIFTEFQILIGLESKGLK